MSKLHPRPTLRSIAEATGVTMMTVSRVLRNQPHVGANVRERVLDFAEKVGYRPNAFASALASYRTEASQVHRANIACLVGHKGLEAHPIRVFDHYRFMAERAREYAAEHGYTVDLIWLYEPGMNIEKVARTIQARGVAGLALLSMHSTEISLPWSDYSCAYISYNNRTSGRLRFPYTTYDIEEDMTTAYRTAGKRGYCRIGLLTGLVEIAEMNHRMLGAYLAARHLLHPKNKLPVFEWHFRLPPTEHVKQRFLRWFGKNRPDAIVCAVRGAGTYLREWGLGVPDEVGVIELNLRNDEDYFSGILRPYSALAEQGVKQVIDQIIRNERGEVENAPGIVLSSDWREGKTLPGR